MPDERVIEQVNGILSLNDVNFVTNENKRGFLVPTGSAAVFLDFFDWGENTVVSLTSQLLVEVDGADERKQKILEALNEKNGRVPFARFRFDEGRGAIVLEYHLLGDNLQGAELMNALGAVASIADEVDDELSALIGSGTRATDTWNEGQGDTATQDSAGPVVEA